MSYLNTNDPALMASGVKYRKELILAPILKVDDLYGQFMTRRFDVRGDEVVGTLSNSAQVKPYNSSSSGYTAGDTTGAAFRTLTTYMGDVIEEFEPYPLSKTLWGNSLNKDIKNFDIVKAVTLAVANSVGDNLANCLFSAVRDSSGDSTSDLFDGFYTIISKEITATNLSTAKGNLVEVDEITVDNVLDVLRSIYQSSSIKLRKRKDLLMYVPQDVLDLYNQAYLAEVGPVNYNNKYEQTILLGSNGKCTLVPVYDEVENAPIILTTKDNMLIGCDQVSQEEVVKVREIDNPHKVQFFMILYFGVQFERIGSDSLMVGKITPVVEESDSSNSGSDNTNQGSDDNTNQGADDDTQNS